jgi:YD repeat-containing protein
LEAMLELANRLGMDMQMSKRDDATASFLVPALVHWKAGHFAAIVKEQDGRYLLQDSTFGQELWVSGKALEVEASGYALVKAGPFPAGWRPVAPEEGALIMGKGQTDSNDRQCQKCQDPQSGGGGGCPGGNCPGMAQYSFHTMLVNLHLQDNPVGYAPPRGPQVRFRLSYNQREVFQPQTPAYGNLGPKWTHDWLSFIEDDPTNGSQPVNVYARGGGQETFTGYNSGTSSYEPHWQSRATVVRTVTSPIQYERRQSDGSIDTYARADGAVAYLRKVFLTRSKDPQGNSLTFTYDASLRLVAVTDAIGQVTTISYELPSTPLKMTKVTDPFGRFARIEYNPSGQLMRITDVIGLTSEFLYGSADFINSMTTAYGTTTFAAWEGGRVKWLEATDPLGAKERLEYQDVVSVGDEGAALAQFFLPIEEVPAGFNNWAIGFRTTFFWDKRASALYPGQYTKAKLTHWEHTADFTQTSGVIENEKNPLESTRTFYTYPDQPYGYVMGSELAPIS